ncbi:SRPBCC family protein [Heyndrickxia ginsengihumi]|uniref:SRPBCC family protein n=1 Tax=Heyndrickxia ginsengihumi TaxID=363870 RepID=UPI0020416077|nr:SRPBCC family protein [Heyndrickxia ginsengihumi]MCM3022733.1 SRPBCC family protein [Heyndrickxia ginsengihumi]
MATGTHTVEIPTDVQAVWDYISDLEKWATTVPGVLCNLKMQSCAAGNAENCNLTWSLCGHDF